MDDSTLDVTYQSLELIKMDDKVSFLVEDIKEAIKCIINDLKNGKHDEAFTKLQDFNYNSRKYLNDTLFENELLIQDFMDALNFDFDQKLINEIVLIIKNFIMKSKVATIQFIENDPAPKIIDFLNSNNSTLKANMFIILTSLMTSQIPRSYFFQTNLHKVLFEAAHAALDTVSGDASCSVTSAETIKYLTIYSTQEEFSCISEEVINYLHHAQNSEQRYNVIQHVLTSINNILKKGIPGLVEQLLEKELIQCYIPLLEQPRMVLCHPIIAKIITFLSYNQENTPDFIYELFPKEAIPRLIREYIDNQPEKLIDIFMMLSNLSFNSEFAKSISTPEFFVLLENIFYKLNSKVRLEAINTLWVITKCGDPEIAGQILNSELGDYMIDIFYYDDPDIIDAINSSILPIIQQLIASSSMSQDFLDKLHSALDEAREREEMEDAVTCILKALFHDQPNQ